MRISSWRIASASRSEVEALLGRLAADDPDRQAGAGERLAPDEPLGQPELGADGADLVLEQRAQRLDELECEVVGQAADVVVGLDRRRAGAAAGLDHVGVERALDEEARVAELGRLLLEDADELGADRLALGLGVGDAGEPREEAFLGVDGDERDLEVVAEGGDDLLALVLAHQAVVDEHARQLVADGAVDEQRRDARVDAAASPQITLPSPTCARIRSICSSTIDAGAPVRCRSRRRRRGSVLSTSWP